MVKQKKSFTHELKIKAKHKECSNERIKIMDHNSKDCRTIFVSKEKESNEKNLYSFPEDEDIYLKYEGNTWPPHALLVMTPHEEQTWMKDLKKMEEALAREARTMSIFMAYTHHTKSYDTSFDEHKGKTIDLYMSYLSHTQKPSHWNMVHNITMTSSYSSSKVCFNLSWTFFCNYMDCWLKNKTESSFLTKTLAFGFWSTDVTQADIIFGQKHFILFVSSFGWKTTAGLLCLKFESLSHCWVSHHSHHD